MQKENKNIANKRVCYACESDETRLSDRGYPYWNSNKPTNYWLCYRCYLKHISNPIHNPIHNSRHMYYKNRIILAHRPMKIGVCNWCRAVVGEINSQKNILCRQTHTHHESYHDTNPEKDTIEVCASCHMSMRRRRNKKNPLEVIKKE